MKHPLASPQEPTLAQVRQKHLVAATGPIWILNLGLHSAAILRSVLALLLHGQGLQTTACEITNLAAYAVGHWLPCATIFFGRADLIETACITAHFVHSMVLSLLVFGVTALPNAATAVLGARLELILCVILTFQYQLSLPVMAFLHAVRQTVWMCIIFWRMDGDPHSLLIRGVCNWTVLMLLSALFEMRIHAAHWGACRALRQQQHQQQGQAEQQEQQSVWEQKLLKSSVHAHMLGNTKESPIGKKPQSAACSIGGHSELGRISEGSSDGHETDGLAEEPDNGCVATTSSGSSQGGLLGNLPRTHSVAAPGAAAAQLSVALASHGATGLPGSAPAGSGSLAVSKTSTEQRAPVMQTPRTSVLVGAAAPKHAQLTASQQHAARALLHAVRNNRALAYRRTGGSASDTVCVKLEGIDLDNMPPDLPKLMHEQLRYCMPGVAMTGLALRSGCVMLTIDLTHFAECLGAAGSALSAAGMRDLITRVMQGQALGQVLEDGAPMCIQMPHELALCRWDSASSSYMSEGAPALGSSDWYSCRMVSAGPAVHSLPHSAAHIPQRSGSLAGTSASHQLTLNVVLELPSNCQLHGWQPAGVAAPAGGLWQDWSQDGPVVDAMLLARRLGGGFLPVVVEPVPCVDLANTGARMHHTSTQVVVTVDCETAAALRLELWIKRADTAKEEADLMGDQPSLEQASLVPEHMPGLELLVAHMPLLVLPGSWKEAAAQLQRHIGDVGGVQPQHALQARTREAANRRSATNMQQVAQPLSHGMGTQPHATSQAVDNTEQLDSAQSVQHRRGPKASDSASSHISLTDDSERNPTWCLLEDLGELLAHHWNNTSLLTGKAAAAMSQLGDGLLLYVVQHGLGAVASLIVNVLQKAEEQQQRSALPSKIGSPSAWLLLAEGCASGGQSETRQSLLHAAMASGNAEMLGHVLSWGGKYGGPDWAWPWELQDATGCTALHLAAAQPAAGACAALLKTITCMLPAAQVQAARNAWLHCQGGVGVTPADLFALASACSGDAVGSMWSTDSPDPPDTGSTQASTSAEGSSGPSRTVTAQPPSTSLPLRPEQQERSWLGSMMEVWTTRESDEYRAWTKRQLATPMCAWAATVIAMLAVLAFRSDLLGTFRYEILHLSLHGVAYIPILAGAVGIQCGGWQDWMRVVRLMEALAYYAKTFIPSDHLAAWAMGASRGADTFYATVISPAIDQAPMYQILIERSCVAFARGLAYGVVGIPHPMRRALLLHLISLVVSTVAGARQLRAFNRFQARVAGGGQKGKRQLPPTSPRKCQGAGPQGEPQIPGQEPLALPSKD